MWTTPLRVQRREDRLRFEWAPIPAGEGWPEGRRYSLLVEYPRRGIGAIGFVTGSSRDENASSPEDELVHVFLPTTPNPTSGFLLFVPRKELVHLDISVEDGMKLVISGGIVGPRIEFGTLAAAMPGAVQGDADAGGAAAPESERRLAVR